MKFPALMQYLKIYEEKARKRDDQGDYWWELRHCAYYPEFEKEKVVWSDIASEPTVTVLPKGLYFNNTVYMVSSRTPRYFAGILNSRVIKWYFSKIATDLGEKGRRFFKIFVEVMPLIPITPANQPIVQQIEALVDKILAEKKQNPQADTKEYEHQIDQLVYKLYDLTPEEIKIVENSRS